MFLRCVNTALQIVGLYLPKDHSWMVDGAKGFRKGIRIWKENTTSITTSTSNTSLRVGMCYYHVSAAVRQHSDSLPNGKRDIVQVLYEIDILANSKPDLFRVAWRLIRSAWVERGRSKFMKYFKNMWIKDLSGWNVYYLGSGPRYLMVRVRARGLSSIVRFPCPTYIHFG